MLLFAKYKRHTLRNSVAPLAFLKIVKGCPLVLFVSLLLKIKNLLFKCNTMYKQRKFLILMDLGEANVKSDSKDSFF